MRRNSWLMKLLKLCFPKYEHPDYNTELFWHIILMIIVGSIQIVWVTPIILFFLLFNPKQISELMNEGMNRALLGLMGWLIAALIFIFCSLLLVDIFKVPVLTAYGIVLGTPFGIKLILLLNRYYRKPIEWEY